MKLLLVLVLMLFSSSAYAGPNAGGVMLLHANENLVWSAGQSYCGLSGLESCSSADVRVDGTGSFVFHLLAAFPPEANPRLACMVVGIAYDSSLVTVEHWEHCADYEVPTQWPLPYSGIGICWDEAQTAHVVEAGWFAAYCYSEDPTIFATVDHPTSGAAFADDSVPSYIDRPVDFGTLGFNTDGHRPCAVSSAPLIPVQSEATLFPSRPNPISSAAEISFRVPGFSGAPVSVDLSIFDAAGRFVRTLVVANLEPGDYLEPWDARDQSGNKVPNGTYFSRLLVKGKSLREQIVVVR